MFRRFHFRSLLLLLIAASAFLALPATVQADEIYLNGFRNPSIGLEYRRGSVSLHSGYYTTILSNEDDSGTQSFVRTGLSLWRGQRWYASLSHLYGLHGLRRHRHFAIADIGLQLVVWERVALRLGVAVIPAARGFETRVNPTPGASLRWDW